MTSRLLRIVSTLFAALPFTLAASVAQAEETPCGNFDFSAGISCSIEVDAGCTAQCTPFKFEVGCTGECTATFTQTCSGSCGEACILECDPDLLDCFKGCHTECDEPITKKCQKDPPKENCADVAVAQCDIHCKESCAVPPSSCQEHCTSCCAGACTTDANYDCNLACFAKLEGSCSAQCSADGGLFCNGQYVNASDISACVTYLATQGINVTGSLKATCDLANGCDGVFEGSGCAVAAVGSGEDARGLELAGLGLAAVGLAFGLARAKPRRR
ncbi:MAG: hypothetical protein EXR75_04870 [Myxococcales bacterium]|nr:hypothetical protein [Myxococcales bacterium]